MIRAVLFDLDGTLLNTVDSMAEAGTLMLRDLGLRPRKKEEYRYFAGDGADMLVRRALMAAGDETCALYPKARKLYLEYFAKTCTHGVAPYPGVLQLLGGLKERGLKLAVLSNKPHAQTEEVVRAYFAEDTFCFIQGQVEGVPRKPDPAGALLLARRMGTKPGECFYLGDTAVDMRTACGAGMIPLGALWGFRTREELIQGGAAHLLAAPEDMLSLLTMIG